MFLILFNNFTGLEKTISCFGTKDFHFFLVGGQFYLEFHFWGCLIRNLKNLFVVGGEGVQCSHITVAFLRLVLKKWKAFFPSAGMTVKVWDQGRKLVVKTMCFQDQPSKCVVFVVVSFCCKGRFLCRTVISFVFLHSLSAT